MINFPVVSLRSTTGYFLSLLRSDDLGIGQNALDLDHLIRFCDFTPMEALQSMTKHGGAAMDPPNQLGQILPGYLADMLIVTGDPLKEPTVLLNRQNLQAIMKDGVFHKRS